jgi:hypothetical protein
MLGGGTRDARRTERYLDGLTTADERRASEVPVDAELDPAIRLAARELRAGLTRVHPSFRFEDALAARLAAAAARLKAGVPVEEAVAVAKPGTLAPFRSHSAPGTDASVSAVAATAEPVAARSAATPVLPARAISPGAAIRRWPERAAHPSRPLIVGGVGVGVASAAISIGAVYVAWRHSHQPSGRMGRAVRAAHGRTTGSGGGRRSGVINGILGVVS